ncbi:MAG: adenylate kinase [Bacteroidetes bacterium]|nr:adenylate kinase [Bacteroidota bacterium]
MFNIIILGAPGCGKGTQSAHIIEKYGLSHISTGDMLREEVELHTAIGDVVKKFIDRGYLVPDDIIMREIFVAALKKNKSKGLLFDGFPRTLFQAEYLDEILQHKKSKIALVLQLEVDEEELFNRILNRSLDSHRSDDNSETIRKRIEVYKKQTVPLIDYYRKQKKLHIVSGMAPVTDVFQNIESIIDKIKNRK